MLPLLKLRAYELTEYDRVLLLDMDCLVMHSLEALFRRSMRLGLSLMMVADKALAVPNAAAPPINGGWLLVAPSLKISTRSL